jgi:molybdopterin converting factor small subunit
LHRLEGIYEFYREHKIMQLTIRLFPPYRKMNESGEFSLDLKQHSLNLEQLAYYLDQKYKDRFDYPLIDERRVLTAEFMVNGAHQPLSFSLSDQDEVSIIPYLCGG